jgi:hypothetical protein
MSWEPWRNWALTGGLLTALAVTGCGGKSSDDDEDSSGPSCTSICDEIERAACPDTSTSTCVSDCNKEASLLRSAGCADLWDPFLECYDGLADKCDANDMTCKSEIDDVVACLTRYCMDANHTAECSLE